MRIAKLAGSLFLIALPTSGQAQDAAVRTKLAPPGTLRVGVAEAPTPGVLFVRRGADGTPQGVTVDLARDLAQSVGVPVAFTVFPNTGEITEVTNAGLIDVTFMPIDEARRQKVDFGPGYYNLESTYLVTEAAGVSDVEGVDRPGMRVVGIAGSTTLRASARTLKMTKPVPVGSVAEAIERLRSGQADALALARDQLRAVQPLVPSSRVATGSFQQTLIAVAVPKERAVALAYLDTWMNEAKRSGLVRQIFDAQGLREDVVAP
ncbi:transporter substrate-binding domain-containing protein [Methylobacterium sp. J-070]|uniref:transporter substrate-binding domain-containing protein n=1 Tax=Methylobacterium sp. J-070 TaxID=2836650 RepID=UPI001FBBD471|nr:transporter substrate-binding domain-containing protein [Methylobacterium sp. J-070]MCJ2054681.1 transporter substrate-binding domain-containing protein [Methylobacterium sp. J-070]